MCINFEAPSVFPEGGGHGTEQRLSIIPDLSASLDPTASIRREKALSEEQNKLSNAEYLYRKK